jgi:ribosomal-protein-alanine N-acetyltransferase
VSEIAGDLVEARRWFPSWLRSEAVWIGKRQAPTIETARLRLVWLDAGALAAIVRGDPAPAEHLIEAAIPDEWVAEFRELCALRLAQMQRDLAHGPWLIRAVVLRNAGAVIGQIGFHGPPGMNGLRADDAAELGYAMLAAYRGQGYAPEAALGLMEWARDAHGLKRFLASTAPSNAGSIRVIEKLSFTEATRVWDDEDGEEIVHELRIQ